MEKCKCQKCGHEWTPRTEHPAACPSCKSYRWKGEIKNLAAAVATTATIGLMSVALVYGCLEQHEINLARAAQHLAGKR